MYWGSELDNGSEHIRKIRAKRLDVEELAGFNHLTVFLRWSAEHDLLNEELLKSIPELKERLCSRNRDPRTVFTDYEAFDGKLRTRHFNSKGKAFAKKYYTFYQGGFAHCVDKYAEKTLGTEKYHCEEYQNEAYLFLPYNEAYYKGLSEYIDKAWNDFCVQESRGERSGREMISLFAICEPIDPDTVWNEWYGFCMDMEQSMGVGFTHIACETESLNPSELRTRKSYMKKLRASMESGDTIKFIEFYALPDDFQFAVFDYELYMSLCFEEIWHCEITAAKTIAGTFEYEKYLKALEKFLRITKVEVNVIPDHSVSNYNMNCILPSKSDGLCDTLRIRNLYRKRTVSDKNKNEVNRIKSELKRSAVIFKTAEGKRDENSLQSWIGRICRKLPQETFPIDRNGKPMLPLMMLLTKGLPELPKEIKGTELITVFISEESLNDCEFEKGDFCVRTYDSLEDLEPCDCESDIIKAFPLIPESVDNDYPDWYSGEIPEDTCDAILRIGREEDINYFDDIVENEYCLHKIGGYPSYIQSGYGFTGYEFVFQIVSDEKAQLMVGDDGNLYFFYNREKDDWKLYCDFY